MTIPRRVPKCLAVLLIAFSPAVAGENPAAGPRLAIVQPGYPGSPRSARGFLMTLKRYLEDKASVDGLAATYYNLPRPAIAALQKDSPLLGVVSLGFYLKHRKTLALEARLETAPADRFYVVAKKGAVSRAIELAGQPVAGGALYEPEFLARIVFPGAGGAAGWRGKPTLRVSRALRELERGEHRALALNGREFRSFEALGKMKTLAKILESDYYPVALLVVFGGRRPQTGKAEKTGSDDSEGSEGLVRAFKEMRDDPTGRSILETMGCEEFREVRSRWLEKLEKRYDAQEK